MNNQKKKTNNVDKKITDIISTSSDNTEKERIENEEREEELILKITQYLFTIMNTFDKVDISSEKPLIIEVLDQLKVYKLKTQ